MEGNALLHFLNSRILPCNQNILYFYLEKYLWLNYFQRMIKVLFEIYKHLLFRIYSSLLNYFCHKAYFFALNLLFVSLKILLLIGIWTIFDIISLSRLIPKKKKMVCLLVYNKICFWFNCNYRNSFSIYVNISIKFQKSNCSLLFIIFKSCFKYSFHCLLHCVYIW